MGELARRTGTTIRALRYYESLGLVVPRRRHNGYREYSPISVGLVEQIQQLTSLGLRVEETRPFVECLADGHDHGDVCPAAMSAYRQAIVDIDDRMARLATQRDALRDLLDAAAERGMNREPAGGELALPNRDPVTLIGGRIGRVEFPATDGNRVDVGAADCGTSVLFVYPLTGRPGTDLPGGFLEIPGARGCTAQACGFRDVHQDLLDAGADRVLGLSAQSTGYQRELVHRLQLPYPLLADPQLSAARELGLPTFAVAGMALYRRLTLIIRSGVIVHVFTDIAGPGEHAKTVLTWLRERTIE